MDRRLALAALGDLGSDEVQRVREMLMDPTTIVAGANPDRVVLLADPSDELAGKMVDWFDSPLFVRDANSLAMASGRVLLSYGTSVIVPPAVLQKFSGRAYNIHAASPHYPGRDPHHWAVYEGAKRYGATMHVMTERVDEGAIVDVEWFDVPTGIKPSELLSMANDAALQIMERNAAKLQAGAALMPFGVEWSGVKRSRKDFIEMCRITPDIDPGELDRRLNAFDGERHANLWTEIHGRRFTISR